MTKHEFCPSFYDVCVKMNEYINDGWTVDAKVSSHGIMVGYNLHFIKEEDQEQKPARKKRGEE